MLASQFNKSKSKSIKTKSIILQQEQPSQIETDSNKQQSNSSFSFNFSIETQEQSPSSTSPFELQFCGYDADKDPQEQVSSSTKRRRRRKKQKEHNSVIRRDVNSDLTRNIHKNVDHDDDKSLSSDDSDDDHDIEAMASFVHSAHALISPSSKNTSNPSATLSNGYSNDLYQLKNLDKDKITEGEKFSNRITEPNLALPAHSSTDQKSTCKKQEKPENLTSANKTDSSTSKNYIALIGKSNTISDKPQTATVKNEPLKKRNATVSETSATSSSTIPPPLANIPNRLLRKTPKKTKSNNTSSNIARQAQLQAIKGKQTKVSSGPPPGFSPKAKSKNSQPVLQFNTSDKGKAMVNHGSIAVHKEKMKNQQHDKLSGNPKNDSQVIGSNAFSFGFNFGSLLEDV